MNYYIYFKVLNMLKFKCHGSIFIFKNEQLIEDLKSIVLVSDFCLFINQLKSKEYYDNLSDSEKGYLTGLANKFLNLKYITCSCKKSALYKLKKNNVIFHIFNLNQSFNLKGDIRADYVKNSIHNYKTNYDLIIARITSKPNTSSVSKFKNSIDDRQYNISLFEDFVYSDANWSHKDASL